MFVGCDLCSTSLEGVVSVLDLYFVSFFYVLLGTGMAGLLGHSEMQCDCKIFSIVLKTCGDWYD